jgi:glutamate synthase (NADPH) large chain
MSQFGLPPKQGLYDPAHEHDACGMGFVVDLKGRKSHDIINQALRILENLEHRGACGCEKNTGDGAGILIQTPHRFLKRECEQVGIDLPLPGLYGAGIVFLPKDEASRKRCEKIFEDIVREEGQEVLGWRDVPTDNSMVGPTALDAEPFMRQVFIKKGKVNETPDGLAFERKLCIIRKRGIRKVRKSGVKHAEIFYIASLSYKTLVYKGMLNSAQLRGYYPDLSDPLMVSALGMVHSRFSTNTFPSWNRAHPYRYLCHNGEINTLRGNINWMHAREARLKSELFGNEELQKMRPTIDVNNSDSGMFDNVLEMLVLTGRSIGHAMMMMIPEPWSGHESMSPEKKAFYEYNSCMMEPWDGPAAVAFTDGTQIGATLDRNGLRPARYYVTKDDRLIMSSEVGVLDIAPENVAYKGRLQPGRMLLADISQGRIIDDEELKRELANEHPYGEWLRQNMVKIEDLPTPSQVSETDHATVLQRQQAFGYTAEDVQMLMTPMAQTGNEAIGSMGTDTPLAVLSNKPQPLYNYFKQLFAGGRDPRGVDHVNGDDHRAGGEHARADARGRALHRAQVAHLLEREPREAAPPRREQPARLQVHHDPDPLQRARGRDGAGARDGRGLPAGERGDQGRLRHHHLV